MIGTRVQWKHRSPDGSPVPAGINGTVVATYYSPSRGFDVVVETDDGQYKTTTIENLERAPTVVLDSGNVSDEALAALSTAANQARTVTVEAMESEAARLLCAGFEARNLPLEGITPETPVPAVIAATFAVVDQFRTELLDLAEQLERAQAAAKTETAPRKGRRG